MKFLGYSSLLISIVAVACKKDELNTLPRATQEGKNTGGCLIDGKAFIATGWPSGGILGPSAIPPLTGGFFFDSTYLVTLYGKHNNENIAIMLYLQNNYAGTYLLNRKTQYYPLGSPQYILSHATYRSDANRLEVYVTDEQHTGKVELVKSSPSSGIGAGTFEFTAASILNPSKTITITNGRFDRGQ